MVKLTIILGLICFSCFGITISTDSISVKYDLNDTPTLSYEPILTIDFDADCTLDSVSVELIDGTNVHSILFSDSVPGIVVLPQRSWVFQFNKISDNIFKTNKLNGYKYFKGNSIKFYSCIVLSDNPDDVSEINIKECKVNIKLFFNNNQKLLLFISQKYQPSKITNFNHYKINNNKSNERIFLVDLKGRNIDNKLISSNCFFQKDGIKKIKTIKISEW